MKKYLSIIDHFKKLTFSRNQLKSWRNLVWMSRNVLKYIKFSVLYKNKKHKSRLSRNLKTWSGTKAWFIINNKQLLFLDLLKAFDKWRLTGNESLKYIWESWVFEVWNIRSSFGGFRSYIRRTAKIMTDGCIMSVVCRDQSNQQVDRFDVALAYLHLNLYIG